MKRILLTIGMLVFSVAAGQAAAPVVNKVSITTHVATRNIGYFDPGESVVMTALVKPNAKTNSIVHTLKFRPRGVDGVTVHTAWHVNSADSPVRLLGVNLDLRDASGNLVASDTYTGSFSGVACSTLEVAGLDPNQIYQLVLTGTRASSAAYSITIE